MKCTRLTLRRSGEVKWHVIIGEQHCGPSHLVRKLPNVTLSKTDARAVGWLFVKYDIVLECAPKVDERGFLLDQVMLDKYINHFAAMPSGASCEVSCMDLAQAILLKIKRDLPLCNVYRSTLTLMPEPYQASITASYDD